MKTHEIGNVIMSLAGFVDKKSEREKRRLIKRLYAAYDENPEIYELEMNNAFHNFSELASLPYKKKYNLNDRDDAYIIDNIYNGLFPQYIRNVIEIKEGLPFRENKVAFITSMVKKAVVSGTNLSLYATFEGRDTIPKEDWPKQAYWSPVTIPDTDTAINMFWDWYYVRKQSDKFHVENKNPLDETRMRQRNEHKRK